MEKSACCVHKLNGFVVPSVKVNALIWVCLKTNAIRLLHLCDWYFLQCTFTFPSDVQSIVIIPPSWEKRCGYLALTRLSPYRTVNHQTSICITDEVSRFALGVGMDLRQHVDISTSPRHSPRKDLCSDNEGRRMFLQGKYKKSFLCLNMSSLSNLSFYSISHTTCSRADDIIVYSVSAKAHMYAAPIIWQWLRRSCWPAFV